MNEQGEYIYNFAEGVENFMPKVLFMAGVCNTITGPSYQERQMELFPDAELTVIRGAGHTMFGERPEESMQVVRDYFKSR